MVVMKLIRYERMGSGARNVEIGRVRLVGREFKERYYGVSSLTTSVPSISQAWSSMMAKAPLGAALAVRPPSTAAAQL
jgi:hypothetical protein